MCEFISWITKGRKVYFLTDKDVEAKGWEFVDSVGHGAIERFYGIDGGEHREVPYHFPPKEVLSEFNKGHMRQLEKAWGKRLEIKGRTVKVKDSTGYLWKSKYNKEGLETKYESSMGYWRKSEYNKEGKQTKYENSMGYWWKREYNKEGKQTKFENSTGIVRTY